VSAARPRISVVVPIYDVEEYLDECLRSLAGQTFADFEAVMVDDGSTDGSAAIAERFAGADPRFRLVRQPNGGLSRARNTGIEAARGEYLAFLDSDDVLPPDAYERLLGALERTGSDFATGNVERMTAIGLTQAPYLAGAFGRARLRTHVRRFAPLLEDRTAWNKLWRRAFWDAYSFRFPDGRIHEDIPVVVPAHFQAAAVDVIAEPVYRYRLREGGALSITQRRHELRALRDRITAIEEVLAYLAAHEDGEQLRRYQRSVLAHDLRFHIRLLPDADDEYRALFMDWTARFLEAAAPGVCDDLTAIDRVRYHLVREGALDQLLAVQRDGLKVRSVRRRYYADYAMPSPPRLGRRDGELALSVHLDDLRRDDGRLQLSGHGYIRALGCAAPDAQRLHIAAVRAGRLRALRMRLAPRRLATTPVERPDLGPRLRWAGFTTALDVATLPAGRWELFATVRAGRLRRRRAVFALDDLSLARTVEIPAGGAAQMRATVSAEGRVAVRSYE
jgi:CDP-glycerol glycerophosphotransferase